MKHVNPLETRSAIPLETRDDDPIAAATRAVEELRTSVTQFRSETDKKIDERLGAIDTRAKEITERLDALDVRAGRPGAQRTAENATETERRALDLFARTGDNRELRALSTDVDPAAGWLVLPQLEAGIRNIARDVSPIARLATTRVIGTGSLEILLDPSLTEVGWVGERQARPETDAPELKKVTIPVNEMYAAPKTTQTLIDDSSASIADWLNDRISTGMAIKEGAAFASGDGVGKPRGIWSYDTDSGEDFTRDYFKIQYVATGATSPSDLQLSNALIALTTTLRTPYRAAARFLMSRTTARVCRQLRDDNKQLLWSTDGRIVDGTPDRLLGFPVEIDDNAPAASSGNLPVAFGDFRQAYTVVRRQGLRLTKDEVTDKPYVIFYTTSRVGAGMVDFNALKFLKYSNS